LWHLSISHPDDVDEATKSGIDAKLQPFVYAASVCGVIVLRAERIGASFRNPQTAA
jgi:hypothetical protein